MEHCQSDLGHATLSLCHGNDNRLTMPEKIFDQAPCPIVNESGKISWLAL